MRAPTTLLALVAMLALSAPPALAQNGQQPELQEWMVPYAESRPRDPMVAPDGDVWFVGQRAGYVAELDPETGDFRKFDTGTTRPHNLIIADDGTIYYAGNAGDDARHIGIVDPETGAIEKIMMPDPAARDPHTLIFDSQEDIWFTVQGGNFIGKMWTDTREVRLVEAPMAPGRGGQMGSSRPYGIAVDSRDRPWIALFNTNLIGTIDPETFELETHAIPRETARPRRIGVTSDDVVWYVDYADGYLGRLDPETGAFTEWMMPSGESSRPYGMAVDDSDRIWFVETGVEPNMFVGFDPMTERFIEGVPLESGGGTVRHMYFDAQTNSVWFGADTNTIGRAELPPKRRPISD